MRTRLAACLLLFANVARADNVADSKALYEQALRAANAGDLDKATPLFQKALEKDPKNFLAAFDLGGAYEQNKDFDKAIAEYKRTVELRPEFAEAHVELGTLLLLAKKDYDGALAELKQALVQPHPVVDARSPFRHTLSQALQNLAVVYAQKQEYGVANAVAESYLKDPRVDRESDPRLRAIAVQSRDDLESALERRFQGPLDEIRALLQSNKAAEALARYREFAKSHDGPEVSPLDRWDLLEGTALAEAHLKQNDAALGHFREAARVAERLHAAKLEESHFNAACAESLLGHTDAALAEIDQVLWLDSITAHDPAQRDHRRYSARLLTDDTLSTVRDTPAFARLLDRYKPLK